MDVSIHLLIYLVLCGLASLLPETLADSTLSFLREPRSRIVRHGIRVKLRCKAEPKDAPLTWSFNGRDITDPASLGMEVRSNGGYLIIQSFQGRGDDASHDGDYQCKAGNETGMIVSRVAHVQAAYLKRFPTHLPETTRAQRGSIAVIACTMPESLPPAIMSYQFKGQPISGSADHYRIMPSGHLHIIDVSDSDEGLYTCSAQNPSLGKTHNLQNGTTLIVEDEIAPTPPTIQTSNGVTAYLGERAILECLPSGVPFPEIRWERLNAPIPTDAVQHPGSLEFTSVRREDAGTYRCTAWSGLEESQGVEVNLEVMEPVNIAKAPKSAYVDLGSTGRFKCSVRGVQQDRIIWLFNGVRISEMSYRHEILDGQLVIHGVMRSDLGPYQCFVQSDDGSAQATARLMLIEGFPDIVDPPVNTTAIEGENVFLSCGITGDPMPFASWHDPLGTVVRNSGSMFISEETGGLTIHRVGPDDVGWYRCRVSNKHGQVEAGAYLAVIEKLSTTPSTETSQRFVLNPPIKVNDDITITTQTTDEPSKPGTVPDAPSKPVIHKTSDTSVETRWEYLSRIPVTSFTIQYRDVSTVDGWVTASDAVPRNHRVFEVEELKEGATYRFLVIATNAHGDSEPSEMSNRFLMHIPENPAIRPPLDPPRIIKSDAVSSTSILVEWEFEPESLDIPVTGFYIHLRNTDSDDNNDYTRTPVVGENVRQYQIRNLELELTYDIKMQTFNEGGESPFSNVVIQATLAEETPPPPLIIPEPRPSTFPSDRNPNIPDLPDDEDPDSPSGQSEDILYITLGVVLGAMLLVLIMFGVMCMWRAKQVNNDRIARDWHYGYYCDGGYRQANGNMYKFGQYMNGNTPQGHGTSNAPFGDSVTPVDPRPLYTMPQDTLDEATYFAGLSPATSPVANGHLPTNHNDNTNHSNEHLYANGSCRSLRCTAGGAGSGSDREGAPQGLLTFGTPGLYSTGERPVCPNRHVGKNEHSRQRKKGDASTSREATDNETGPDNPSLLNDNFPAIVAPTAPSPGHQTSSQQCPPSATNQAKPCGGSHDPLTQSQDSILRKNVKHSDI